jgi:tripartite-type tricarboxylate transporter receptor subunit TctC
MAPTIRLIAALAALLIAGASHAQPAVSYPTKQVRMIVPYPPGGPTDVIARLLAQKLTEEMGQQFYVENLSGASGAIGAGTAANAPGDGYTLLVVTNDFAVAPSTTAKLPYDPVKNFTPVSIISSSPQVVIVNPTFAAKSMSELVAMAKADPGKYSYASISIGFGQLTSERLFKLGLKIDLTRVPFPGAAPIINSTVGGHTPIAFIGLPPAAPLIKEGKLRALVVTSNKRAPQFPDVPTTTQDGIPNQESELLIGMVATAGTPKPVVDLLQRQIARIVALPDVKARFDTLGFTPVASTPEAYAAQIRSDIETWSKVVKDLGMKVE